MNFERLEIRDLILCSPKILNDDRGYFVETFVERKLNDFLGFNVNFCQDNESKSSYGVLRGLHYQLAPYAQSKLVRVIKGSVLDVAIDLRKNSSTFGQHISVELSENNKKQLFIPRGFAHGFIVLSEEAILAYKVDNYYSASHERGISFDDKDLSIDWRLPTKSITVSTKDKKNSSFQDSDYFDFNNELYA